MSTCAPWTTREEVRALPGFPDASAIPDATVDIAVTWASDVLYDLSGQQWPGECTDTVRPQGDHRCRGAGWQPRQPFAWPWLSEGDAVLQGGGWFGRGCFGIPEVDLGVYPLVGVTEVLLDGVDLDPSAYRVGDNHRLLTRVDGNGWPCWQDLTKAPTEAGTWQVTFTYGEAPPAGGNGSAMIFAKEIALALGNDKSCRLPSRTQQVARQGVTIVAYPQSILDGGRTGLPEVDLWLGSVNPKKTRHAATIVSPDFPPGVRRTP